MTNFRLFPSTNGPASSTAFAGSIVEGVIFQVTSPGYQLQGYWWWRADSSQAASASFALWTMTAHETGTVVSGSTASVSSLPTGQWTYTPLATPISLSTGVVYQAQVGTVNNFPFTSGFYTTAVTNGPLTAFADSGDTGHDVFNDFQCVFTTGSSNPATTLATTANSSYNCWLDVQVGPPAIPGTSAGLLMSSFP